MNLYIDLLEKVVRNEIYLADFYDSTNIGDIETCQLVIDDLRKNNIGVLEKYPHLQDARKFADMINYTKSAKPVQNKSTGHPSIDLAY